MPLRWQIRRWAAVHNREGGNAGSEDTLVGCVRRCSSSIAPRDVCSCMSACSDQLDWARHIYLQTPQTSHGHCRDSFQNSHLFPPQVSSLCSQQELWSKALKFTESISLLRSKTGCQKLKTQCLPSLRKTGADIGGLYSGTESFFMRVEVTREERIRCHRFFSLPVSYFTMSTEVEDPQIHTASSLNYFHLPPTWTWFVTPLCPIPTTSHLMCGSAYPQFSFPLCLMLQQDPRALHC